MEKKSKIRYVILIIAVITGFTCIFTAAVNAESTKLAFEAEAVQYYVQPQETWMEDGVYHIRQHRENFLFGTIDDTNIGFTGYNVIDIHIKIDLATGELIGNGKVTWYITWNEELEGTFYGPVNIKGLYMGPYYQEYNGKITLQGAGDFNGWKLFGLLSNLPGSYPPTNTFSGTFLIPN